MTVQAPALAQLYSFSEPKMGAVFEITISSTDSAGARNAAYRAFERIDEINQALSDYSEQSETWKINAGAAANWTDISQDLATVLVAAQRISNETFGAFDPTVGSIVQLWRRARRKNELPEQAMIDEAVASSGFGFVLLDTATTPEKIRVVKEGVKLDFGGIGKGYAADEALKILVTSGFPNSFVSASSSIAAGGPPQDRETWEFIFDNRKKSGEKIEEVVRCQNCFIASSGDLFQYMEMGGRRYSHIIDPETGEALTNGAFAVVVAPSATQADAYATAFCVMEMEEIRKFLEANEGLSARVWKAVDGAILELSMGKHFRADNEKP